VSRFLVPLGIFLVVVGFLYAGLRLDPREVPSPLIGKPAPVFDLPVLEQPGKRFVPADMKGKVWLLNVWASWCVTCREEHPLLVELSRKKLLPILGLNYKDKDPQALEWLKRFGDPYDFSVVDADGRIGIDYGVYGVPETYLIDADGVIRYKQIGAITPAVLEQKILPLAQSLRK
jgi:cytochrome c biogenesis protein CcmG, thiol:disulfide interchange protein DsbE